MGARAIDIGDGCKSIHSEQQDSVDRHWVGDKIMAKLIPSDRNETLYFERTFDFNCPKMPTSLNIRMVFTRDINDNVTCGTFIWRTDDGTGSVIGNLLMSIRHHEIEEVALENFSSVIEYCGVREKAFESIISYTDALRLHPEPLLVEFRLTVAYCHSQQHIPTAVEAITTRDLEGSLSHSLQDMYEFSTGGEDSEDSPPKKRICVDFISDPSN